MMAKGARFFRVSALQCVAVLTLSGACRGDDDSYRLQPVAFEDLPGFAGDRLEEAFRVFIKSCSSPPRVFASIPRSRIEALRKACASALSGDGANNPRAFFEMRFEPFLVVASTAPDAFFTGYYLPEIAGSLTPSAAFPVPVYALPPDLNSARGRRDGGYPDRGAIEDGALEKVPGIRKLVYLRDTADLFLAQVQGSARVKMRDGRILQLSFAGRNGQPYTALARILVQRGVAPASEMTMPRLIDWLRQNGLERGQPGDDLLRLNKSFVFFEAKIGNPSSEQPRGGGGAALSPLRSIAIDAHVWPYGLPFFIDSRMPWRGAEAEPFQRLMIAQDTGSAIVGPSRADVFFGFGDAAGARAGEIRHHGRFFVLLPKE
jgi:membrane-bound lytic murein transglycosylase A